MKMIRNICITIALLLVSNYAYSQELSGNGQYYYQYVKDNNEKIVGVSVCKNPKGTYKGDIVINDKEKKGEDEYPVISISASAFANSKISTISIPATIKEIGNDAFLNCYSIDIVKYDNGEQFESIKYGNRFSNPMKYSEVIKVKNSSNVYEEIDCITFNTEVKNYACVGAKSLKKVKIDKVTVIGKEAFSECKDLSISELPEALEIIGEQAFNGCSNLTISQLPQNLTTIGEKAFFNCSGISSILIPKNVKHIGSYAFAGCSNLVKATTEAELDDIILPDGIFSGCKKLKTVSLSENITKIGEKSFYECESMSDISQFKNITNIGKNAFGKCGFTNLEIPKSVNIIKEGAFKECKNLATLIIQEDAELHISSEAFSSQNVLKKIYSYAKNAPNAASDAFNGNSPDLSYPEDGKGYDEDPWRKFTHNAITDNTISFYIDNELIKEIKSQVGKKIVPPEEGYKAGWFFHWDQDIPEVMPNGEPLKIYGYYTTTQKIPNDKCTLAYYLQSYGPKQAIIVEDKVINETLTGLVVYPTIEYDNQSYDIKSIMPHAFKGAKKLENVNLSEAINLTSIGNECFSDCESLNKALFPKTVTVIADNMFWGCKLLSEFTIPDNVTTIGKSSFSKSGITEIKLPKELKDLGEGVFMSCTKLNNVDFGDLQIEVLPKNTFYNTNLKKISLPKSITTIDENSFGNCSQLEFIVLDEYPKLSTINSNAFSNCRNLQVITLPASLTEIGSNAFSNCENIKNITLYSQRPPRAAHNIFTESVFNNNSLYTPQDAITDYEQADPWARFRGNINGINNDGYTVTYKVDGEDFGSQTVKVGTQIAPLDISEHKNYNKREFSEWQGLPSQNIMPNSDIVVTGAFKYQIKYVEKDSNNEIYSDNLFYGDNIKEHEPKAKLERKGNIYEIEDEEKEDKTPEVTMPNKDYTLYVRYIPTEVDKELINGYYYHIYLDNDKEPHAELMPGDKDHSYSEETIITIPSTVTYPDNDNGNPYTVSVIRSGAFMSCKKTTNITIPKTITTIGERAFAYCNSLYEVTIPESVKELGKESFLFCDKLREVHFENGIDSLASHTFKGCTNLKNIELPSSLRIIDEGVFMGCNNLKNISITKNIERIGDNVFHSCNSLDSIRIINNNNVPAITEYTFDDNTYLKATLWVDKSVNIEPYWDKFENIIRNSDESETKKCESPKLIYDKGTILFECETKGAIITSEIIVSDAGKIKDAKSKELEKIYTIKAYATAENYQRSDIVTATITWYDGKPVACSGFEKAETETTETGQLGIPGDMNNDNMATAIDAVLILKNIVGKNRKE